MVTCTYSCPGLAGVPHKYQYGHCTGPYPNSHEGDKMAKMVYDEWYGELSYAQRAAYRKYNVSPSDHDALVERYGAEDHAGITAAVKRLSQRTGMFEVFDMWQEGSW